MNKMALLCIIAVVFLIVEGCTQTQLQGALKLPVQGCVDTDSGVSYHIKGEVRFGDKTYSDSCTEEGRVLEYYCNPSGRPQIISSKCPSGTCYSGACVG